MATDHETRRVLLLFAHPALHRSRVNRRLLAEASALEGVTVHDLYEAYTRFDIDVAAEQRLLDRHDALVVQHPFYWYSTPSIVKEWQDLVLEHGWAYGAQGQALSGKLWLQVTSTGAPERAYCATGRNRFTVRQLLAPLEQTARLCGMRFLPPFVVHDCHAMGEAELEAPAQAYRDTLIALRDGQLDLDAISELPWINGPRGCDLDDAGA